MPAYEYEAIDQRGRSKRGIVSADTERQARSELRRLSLTPVDIKTPKGASHNNTSRRRRKARLSSSELVAMTRQLAALTSASTPLVEGLNAVALQAGSAAARARILAVRERVMEGWRFADALKEDQKSFPSLYRAVIAAGETSGNLGSVLDRLATMLEKNRAMRSKAIASLIYPAALLIVAGGVVTALMIFVVPKIIEQFNTFDAQLPFLTQLVIGLSNWILNYGAYALIATFLGAIAFWRAMKEKRFKLFIDRQVLRTPVFGRLAKTVDGARFARTLATLFAGGAPLMDSLVGAQRTVSNEYIRSRIDATVTMVAEGSTLAASLRRAGELPPMLSHMAAAGERSGALPELLEKAAVQLEEEFDTVSTVALRLLEPAIILAMGGAVLVIVLSIMLPILRLNSLAAG